MHPTQNSPIKICILYKTGPDLYRSHWMSKQNHARNKEKENMKINITTLSMTTDIPPHVCQYKTNKRKHKMTYP